MRQTCLNMVYDLAKRDKRVLFIGSDLSPGLLGDMKKEMPERWYMEGITEANVIGMAAGFAMEGYIPYVNTIATFITRRCYEQVAVDLCLHELPVRLIGNGGVRRQGDGAADELHARLAEPDLYPSRQGRRSGGQPRRERFCHRQGDPDAAGTLAARHRAAGDRRDDHQLPCRGRSLGERRARCLCRAFPHRQAARRRGRPGILS